MERTTTSTRRRLLSPGGWAGLVVACLAVGWLLYTFLQELTPARTQRLGDLEISLYSTLTGRPRLGVNQFEVKLRDLQGQPVSQAQVAVRYGLHGLGPASTTDTRFEGYGIFSVVLNFPEAGDWHATVIVGRPGLPELSAPFIIRVE